MVLQNRPGAGGTIYYYRKDSLFLSGVPPTDLLGPPFLPPEERHLSVSQIGEKERNYLFKSYTDLE